MAAKKSIWEIDIAAQLDDPKEIKPEKGWREKLYEVIFESNTPAGKFFDVALVIFIFTSVITLMLESVNFIRIKYTVLFKTLEWFYTIVFTIEYILRLMCVRSPIRYAKSTYGIIDLMSVLPSYLELFVPNTHFLLIVRSFRLLRVFRIFKMVKFLQESRMLTLSLLSSYRKITIFLFFVLLLTIFFGSLMYVVEYKSNPGFTNIPQSIYWAIVTLTTVGYGDVAPVTALGKMLASFIMILGYAIIAVPTGLVTASIMKDKNKAVNHHERCGHCLKEGHDQDAEFCKYCGFKLEHK
ncbi:MAG TPA: ion transporter [Flavobacteriales bacterium]